MLSLEEHALRRRFIARAPHVSRAELTQHRDQLLGRLLHHAFERVPYYRDVFNERGVHPSQIRDVADLARLPMLTRKTLQGEPLARLVSSGVETQGLHATRSSGSTGEPVEVLYSLQDRGLYERVWRRSFTQTSPSYGGRIAYVGLDPQTQGLHAIGQRSVDRRPASAIAAPVVIECRQPSAAILSALIAADPDTILGYPSVLAELARHSPPSELARLRPQLIVTFGEVLLPSLRALLAERIGGQVTSLYACTECLTLGSECPAGSGFHVADDSVVVEVVDERGEPVPPGATGQVLITGLHGFAQPLIRYALGDVAVQGEAPAHGSRGCACGVSFSTLGNVHGRQLDYLVLPDGRRLHAYAFSIPLRDGAPFLQRYQIVQDRPEHIVIRMICPNGVGQGELAALRRRLQGPLSPDVSIDFEIVERLDRDANGKFRVVVSQV